MVYIIFYLALGTCVFAWHFTNDRKGFEKEVDEVWNSNYYTRLLSRTYICYLAMATGILLWVPWVLTELYIKIKFTFIRYKLYKKLKKRSQ